MTKIILDLPEELIKVLKAQAKAANISLDEWIETVLAYGLAVTDPALAGAKENER